MTPEETLHEPTRRNWGSFWSLMGLQAQNAFNDKALQYTLLPLGIWIASGAAWEASFVHVLGLLILLPFILFAPISGWMSDNFSKTRIIRFAAWMQLVVLIVALSSVGLRMLPLGVLCFFFLALQSTILSPAKLGIIKELVGSRRLGFASGVMEMLTILAILAGQIAISFWFRARLDATGDGWVAAQWPMFVVTGGAVITLGMAYAIEVVPAQARKPFRPGIVVAHFAQLGHLFRERPLRLSALGVAYFWAFGTVLQLISIQIARELYPSPDPRFASSAAWMMLAAGGGIALGSIAAAIMNKRHIELGIVPLGGIIMVIATLLLALSTPESALFYTALAAAGVGVAFFFVPINAFLQDECDPAQRGNVLAGSNLLNCLAMATAVLLQLGLIKLGLTPKQQFLLIGVATIPATWYVMRLLPRPFVKLLVLSALRSIYRIDARHTHRMPEEGGVLLTPNHISYLDALILTAASPRPVRFLMVHSYFKIPLVGRFAKLFDTVPISTTRAKDAIETAAAAVREGTVVCIFPEGELSRSGMLGEVKRGFELIARRADCVVQPVYLDGLWKSIFSAERGKYFFKWPRSIPFGVRVVFGDPRPARESKAVVVKQDLNRLAATALIERREAVFELRRFVNRRSPRARAAAWWSDGAGRSCTWSDVRRVMDGKREPDALSHGHEGASRWLAEWAALAEAPEREIRGLILNTHQLAEVHNLGFGKHPIVLEQDAPQAVRRVWGMLLPVLTRSYPILVDPEDDPATLGTLHEKDEAALRDLVGSGRLAPLQNALESEAAPLNLYRFDGEPEREEEGAKRIFACREAGGRILSVSLPHAPITRKVDPEQPGWHPGAFGRLLTGYVAREEENVLVVEGEMLEAAIELPGWLVDAKGFLWGPKGAA